MRALVLGAGLAGLAAAYRLSQEGWEVLVSADGSLSCTSGTTAKSSGAQTAEG